MNYSPNFLDDPTCDPPEQPQHPIPIHLKTSSHLIMQAHPISTPPPPTREPDSSWHQWAMKTIPAIINHLRQHHNLSYTTNRMWSSYTPPPPTRIKPRSTFTQDMKGNTGLIDSLCEKNPPCYTPSQLNPIDNGSCPPQPKPLATVNSTLSDKTIQFDPANPDTLGPWLFTAAFKESLTTTLPDSHPQLITSQEVAHTNVERVATNLLQTANSLASTALPHEWGDSIPPLTFAVTKVVQPVVAFQHQLSPPGASPALHQ